jgi:hypothetical protein
MLWRKRQSFAVVSTIGSSPVPGLDQPALPRRVSMYIWVRRCMSNAPVEPPGFVTRSRVLPVAWIAPSSK